jgi:phosphoribosylanthranilate isomerase
VRTRIKICGITRVEDGLAAVRAGADAIGLVFDARSPRYVSFERAHEIAAAMPPFVTVVGLFVDADAVRVREALGAVRLDLLQFHGSESPDYCRQFAKPFLKAISMREGVDLHRASRDFAAAAALLLDTHVADVAGGSGRTFDWNRIPRDLGKPVILAGGLGPDNVAEAVRRVRPYAVDVSSGVEQSKGIKDHDKIAAFIAAVRGAE